NEVGGIHWTDLADSVTSEALGIRLNDVGGIRWNEVGGVLFDGSLPVSVDLGLLNALSFLPDSSSVDVIVTYATPPTQADFFDLAAIGITGGETFRMLPLVALNATKDQVHAIASFSRVRSIYANKSLGILDHESAELIGVDEMAVDPDHRLPDGRI